MTSVSSLTSLGFTYLTFSPENRGVIQAAGLFIECDSVYTDLPKVNDYLRIISFVVIKSSQTVPATAKEANQTNPESRNPVTFELGFGSSAHPPDVKMAHVEDFYLQLRCEGRKWKS